MPASAITDFSWPDTRLFGELIPFPHKLFLVLDTEFSPVPVRKQLITVYHSPPVQAVPTTDQSVLEKPNGQLENRN